MSVSERRVAVNSLEVGQTIRLPLSWKEHPFLFNTFTIKDSEQLTLIAKLGLQYVYLRQDVDAPPEQPDFDHAEADQVQDEQLSAEELERAGEKERQRRIAIEFRRDVKRCEKAYAQGLEQLKTSYGYVVSSPDRAFGEASVVLSMLHEQVEEHGAETLLLQLCAFNEGSGIHYHSLRVCVLSMLLARACGVNDADIRLLTMAALFHDIGKLRVPHSILNKRIALSKAEQAYLDAHPQMAQDMLKGSALGHRQIKEMVANHHEMLDGSGYPNGLKGKQISKLTQLLIVANEYDTLLNSSKKPLTPHVALAYLFKFRRQQLNEDYMQTLVKVLGLYPVGSLVRLSNEAIARVVGIDPENQKLPKVIIYDPDTPKREAPIVSLKELSLEVDKVLSDIDLPDVVRNYLTLSAG